jgi:hypothetical protein
MITKLLSSKKILVVSSKIFVVFSSLVLGTAITGVESESPRVVRESF